MRSSLRAARRRAALVVVVVVPMVWGGVALAEADADQGPADAPPVEAPEPPAHADQPLPGRTSGQAVELRGAAAIARLGSDGSLDDAAANASMTASDLASGLIEDPTMFVTSDGMVGYAEPATLATSQLAEPDEADDPLTIGAADPADVDVFDLSSRPGTGRVVYLDFDGHTTTNDYWNSTYGIPTIVSGAYDVDGVTGFSAEERRRITEIWAAVADDYAPFGIDVTTRDPGVDGLRRTSSGDTRYGTRVVITPSDWYHGAQGVRIGGIALIDVFSSSIDHSAFVFSSNLGGGIKTISEAATHEAGHNLGLAHDGKGAASYYTGHGDWAPIMGVGYSKAITQWSKGQYAGATNPEDDLALIRQHVPVATDDHADTAGAATTIVNGATASGAIGVADVDAFRVTVGAGPLTVTVVPTGTNLHARVSIRTDSGITLASASPSKAVGWTVSAAATVAAGTYVVEVAPIGWLTADTGFTDYASLGGYRVTAAGAPGAPPPVTTTTTTTPPSTTPTTAPPAPPAGSSDTAGFVPVAPTRIVDTRTGLGGKQRLAARQLVAVQVAGRHGIAANASAAVINVAAVLPAARGYLSVFPCTGGAPTTSTVNYAANQVIANTTIATLDARGRLCVWTLAGSDVLVDITGWMAPGSGTRLDPVGPVRVADTRTGLGGSSRLRSGSTLQLDLRTWAGSDADAVAVNVTVVDAATSGYLTVYPCGSRPPASSTVNHGAREVRPNNTIVGLGHGATVCIYSLAAADVLVDLVGVFSDEGLGYVPALPSRLVDTRSGPSPLAPGAELRYRLGSAAGRTPAAAFVNLTVLDHPRDGYTSTFPCGPRPGTSTVNQVAGEVVSNGAIARATSAADSCVYTLTGGHVIVDLTGWWV